MSNVAVAIEEKVYEPVSPPPPPSHWWMCGSQIPRAEIVFFAQIIIIYIVIITCIVNLSLHNGDSNLWTALMSCCLGYILPAPTLKTNKKD